MSLLKKYFDYHSEFFSNEFVITLSKIASKGSNGNFQKILEELTIDENDFFKQLQKESKLIQKNKLIKKINRSPHDIQDKSYLWPYYSLYFMLELYKSEIKFTNNFQRIADLVFAYHLGYLRTIHNTEVDLLYKLNQLAQAIVRAIEILITFLNTNNEEIINLYFDNYGDIFLNFVDVLNDKTELEKYKVHVPNKRIKNNFILYMSNDMEIEIDTTRKLVQTDKIIDTIVDSYHLYIVLIEGTLDLSRQKEKICQLPSKHHTGKEDVDIVDQVLTSVRDIRVWSDNLAEKIEQSAYSQVLLTRDSDDNIPNNYRQRLKNRAISANITKNNLLSTKSYKIPPKPLLKDFIKFLFKHRDEDKYKFFNIIFIFGIISGQSYRRTLEYLHGDTEVLSIRGDKIQVKLHKNLFSSKNSKEYFEGNEKKVTYYIPYLLSLTLSNQKKFINNIDDIEEEYHQYIKDTCSSFYKTIIIDTKSIHKISLAYLREHGTEDMTNMFCTAIYSQNDTAKLAYTSIHIEPQYYSTYLETLYNDLGVGEVLKWCLDLKGYQERKIKFSEKNMLDLIYWLNKRKLLSFFMHGKLL
ncbi:MAG: hypothetical protein QM490_00555 [Candidatus Gracilibacteria bacterium]